MPYCCASILFHVAVVPKADDGEILIYKMGLLRKSLNWYAKLSPARGKAHPPFEHVVQMGDPTLRKPSEPVPVEDIQKEEVQKVIRKLFHVLQKYDSVGMSAPQIGVNLRIFVMRLLEKDILHLPKEYVKIRGMSPIPQRVFVNPVMKVVDYQKLVFTEGCESIKGYAADVPRYREIELTGHDGGGAAVSVRLRDWAARVAQHELDHLSGRLYVDVMAPRTMHCTCWEEVNLSRGRVRLPFYPE